MAPGRRGGGGQWGKRASHSLPLSLATRALRSTKEQPYHAHYDFTTATTVPATVPFQCKYQCKYHHSTTPSTALAGIEPSNLTTTARARQTPAHLHAGYSAPVPRPPALHATHRETRIKEGTGKRTRTGRKRKISNALPPRGVHSRVRDGQEALTRADPLMFCCSW